MLSLQVYTSNRTVKDYIHFTVNDFVMDRYFQEWVRSPNPENNSFWRTWMAGNPQKVAEVEEARHILRHLTIPEHKLTELEISNLWSNIRGERVISDAMPQPAVRKLRWRGLAAAAIVMLGVVFYAMMAPAELVVYETAYGETRNITLPDQSVATLNANSRLTFVDNWATAETRTVTIAGEAYFTVTHKENNQPFLVRTEDGVAVEVLGTTFNVYHRTNETKVLLNSGKISLSLPTADAGEKIIMKPGELVEFKSRQVVRKSVDPQKYVAWTEHKLILDHTSLRDMVKMLRDNYGLKVEVTPASLLDQTVSGSMPAAEEGELVDQIARAFRLTTARKGNNIIMKEKQ